MYTSASSCLKSVMTEWWPRNNLKKTRCGLPLHFLGLLLDAWLEDCLLPLLTGRQQQQLIKTLHFWLNRLKTLGPIPPTCDPARTAPLSCIWGENNWASEKLSASQQELCRTLQHCEETQRSANNTWDERCAPLSIPFFLSLFLIWRGWGRALPFDCQLPVKIRKK